jgi:ribosomal protein L28
MTIKISKTALKLIDAAVEIDQASAQEAGKMAFFPKSLVYTTLPHRDPKVPVYLRKSNDYRLLITGDPDYGVPFGPYPRLFICWLVTEIVKTKQKRFGLGNSFAQFLKSIALGDDSRTRKGVKNQMLRMQYANIKVGKTNKHSSRVESYDFFNTSEFWWDDKVNANQMTLQESFVEVSDNFYQMALEAMPIDLRAVKALKQSPKALDVYMWLTLRLSHLQAPLDLSWRQLQEQFGEPGEELDDFRRNFRPILTKVNLIYHAARFNVSAKSIKLLPSPPHVQKVAKKESY